MSYIVNAIRGFCMALADSVPGVSGGTIAFVLGFYDQFIESLDHLVYGNKEDKLKAIQFLAKIGIGWIIGMIAAVLVLTSLFQNHIYEVSSLFIGFILLSIPFIAKQEKKHLKGKYQNIIFLVIGILMVALITYFNPMSGSEQVVDISNLNLGLGIYVFLAGLVAISAMVLPGISGSTLLLIFGLYIPIMNSIKEVLHFHFNYFPILIVFGLGIITGVVLIIKAIKVALEKFRSATIYFILGLMIGSIYAIVMGPTTLEIPKDPISFETFHFIFFILGGFIIMGLEKLKVALESKTVND